MGCDFFQKRRVPQSCDGAWLGTRQAPLQTRELFLQKIGAFFRNGFAVEWGSLEIERQLFQVRCASHESAYDRKLRTNPRFEALENSGDYWLAKKNQPGPADPG
jgi:hypothetical protein